MVRPFFIGIDGGASKCTVRIEDEYGQLVGEAKTGVANIRLSVDQAWTSINTAIKKIVSQQALSLSMEDCHVGIGIAGCEVNHCYQAFLEKAPPFASLVVTSDAHAACLGAHSGQSGAVIIAGTGVVACQLENGEFQTIGGMGFPHDDEGGGAWLGLKAVNQTIKAMDGREAESSLSKAVLSHFDNDEQAFVSWINEAKSTQFAELAPIVLQQSEEGEPGALTLVKEAASMLEQLANVLLIKQVSKEPLPLSLMGSVARCLKPYLSEALKNRVTDCQSSPEMGAIYLARRKEQVEACQKSA